MTKAISRVLAPVVGASLAIAACGGQEASSGPTTSETANRASTTTEILSEDGATTTSSSTPTTAEADVDAWIRTLNTAWRQFGADNFELLLAQGDASRPDWGTLQFEIDFLESSSEIAAALVVALDDPPSEVLEPANEWKAVIERSVDDYAAIVEAIEAAEFPVETLLDDVPSETLETIFEPFPDTGDVLAACFDFAASAAGLADEIVDCANSEDVDGEIAATQETGSVPVGRHDLDTPGVYSFDTVPLPFSYDVSESTSVVVGEREVEFFVEEAGVAPFFHVVAVDEIIDPSMITESGPNSGFALGPMVAADDLGTWFEQLPFEIERGTSVVRGLEIPYWRLLDIEWDGGDLPMYGWAVNSSAGTPVHLISPGSVFWQVAHPDGLLVVYANRVVEAPDDVPSTERLTIGEAFLESLIVPE